MTNEEFFNAHRGERVLYKGKDIWANLAGYLEDKYLILGFAGYQGCIKELSSHVKTVDRIWRTYRFAKLKYVTLVKH